MQPGVGPGALPLPPRPTLGRFVTLTKQCKTTNNESTEINMLTEAKKVNMLTLGKNLQMK